MSHVAARSSARRSLLPVLLSLVVVAVAIVGIVLHPSVSVTAPALSEVLGELLSGTSSPAAGALTQADGVLPDGVTVFSDQYPGVTKLDADLLTALRHAATDAARDGVQLYVNSGWRSPGYQDELLSEAVAEYGSRQEAARWVATAQTSPHVSGEAADIGHSDADAWLSEHGAAYGLCQIYRNEPWHFELRTQAISHGCPRMYADPTQDPRMQQ